MYSMAQVQGHNVAGLGERQDESIPPHWNCYVTVEDVDASAARAAELGANILAPPFDVFDAGRMAAFADPQGAVLSIWQAKENIGARTGQRRRRADLERPGHARRRGLLRLLQRALRLGDRRGPGVGRPVLVDHQRRPAQRRPPADHRGRPSGVEPLLRLRGRRRDGGQGERARRGDLHGPDGRAQRVALRDPARPQRRGLQRLGGPDGRLGARSSQSCQSTPVSPRYAATATPKVGKKRAAPIASSTP